MTAISTGGVAFFAGGIDSALNVSDVVDYYQVDTNQWKTHNLEIARSNITAVTLGSKVYFVGGKTADGFPSDKIDIYDVNDGKLNFQNKHLIFSF